MAGDVARAAVEVGVVAVVDYSRSVGTLSISLKIDNAWIAGALALGTFSLGALYLTRPVPTENAIRRGLEGHNQGVVDPEVMNIANGSILVELHCHTETSFLLFLEDFEKKIVKFRLEREFKKIGFNDDLDVTIRNAEEVYEKARQIKRYIFSTADDVAQQENNGFGPLSKPRGRAATIAAVVVVLISGVVLVFAVREKESKEGILFLVFAVALLTLSLVVGELVRRICLITEEFQHQQTRYQGKWKNVFDSTFAFGSYGRSILIVTVASVLIVCYALYEHYEAFSRPVYAILFSLNCFLVPQLLFLVGLRELSAVETSELNERKNKNVADGLAWSFYFGYLKFVLPELEKQIGSSDEFRFKITEKKLFILLPKTCYTYDDIVDADPRVEFAGHLPELKKSRGGIKERSYKHAVHRVEMPRPDGKIDEYHFVLEYATPLMSLYDMSVHAEAPLTAQERDHQVVLFIRKLKEILDGCPECKGKYELVPISGNENNKIADVLVGMHHAANIEVDAD